METLFERRGFQEAGKSKKRERAGYSELSTPIWHRNEPAVAQEPLELPRARLRVRRAAAGILQTALPLHSYITLTLMMRPWTQSVSRVPWLASRLTPCQYKYRRPCCSVVRVETDASTCGDASSCFVVYNATRSPFSDLMRYRGLSSLPR